MTARGQRRPSQEVRASARYQAELRALGLRVRALREAQALTLEAAGEAMDIDATHLQKIEAGRINLTMVTLVRIADGLKVSLRDLFGGSSPAHG